MEDQTMQPVSTNPSRPEDACGCAPTTGPLSESDVGTDGPAPAPPSTVEEPATAAGVPRTDNTTPRRGLKLVVTLRPTQEPGYRALLALGADGCDPVLHLAMVDGLPAALDRVPALLDVAEARWRVRPRNPTVGRPDGRRGDTDRSRPSGARDPAQRAEPSGQQESSLPATGAEAPTSAEPVVAPNRAAGGQFTLFG
jgi:hypothetical protein